MAIRYNKRTKVMHYRDSRAETAERRKILKARLAKKTGRK